MTVALFGKKDREAVGSATMVFALLAAVLAFAALITAAHAESNSGGGGGGASSIGATQVSLSEFKITPASVSAPVDSKITVINTGSAVHNLNIEGTSVKTSDIQPGSSQTISLKGLKAGSYTMYCNIAGHRQAGMQATLVIGGTGNSSNTATGLANLDFNALSVDQLAALNDQMDNNMLAAVQKYVKQLTDGPNTKGLGNQPLAPTVLPDGTKEFHLTAELTQWEVEVGKPAVRAWTYNGTVPGPWLKVNPGDKVKIVVKNNLPQSTGMHLHGITVPFTMDGVPDVTQDPIKPGQSFTYAFTASTQPELGLYHSHHDAQVQVPNGMMGFFQIGEPPLPAGTARDQEVPMILNDAGVIGLSLNGKSFPSTLPVMAKVNSWTQVDYANEGLLMHPMHLHGLPQLVIAKDGFPVPTPYYVDTLVVAPGERYSVLVHATPNFLGPNDPKTGKATPGIWAFHCHILTHAEGPNGMFGMVTTFIVTP